MLHIIINPTAGNGRAARTGRDIEDALTARGLAFTSATSQRVGHATALARDAVEAGAQTVIAVGGDGTLREVARGLTGTGTALGIIPGGTGNDVVKMLGTPRMPMEALDFILATPARPLDAGLINDMLFLNVCGTGMDVVVLDYALSAKKYVSGMLPYLWGVIRALFSYKPVQVTITCDDGAEEAHSILLAAIGNGRYIGGGMNVTPDARPDDGLFDLLVIDNMPRWRLPPHLPKLLNGKIRSVPGTTYHKCRRVTLHGEGMRVNIDGEIIPMDAAVLQILPGALKAHW